MKTQTIVLAWLLAAASSVLAAEGIDIDQLPHAVKGALEHSAKGEPVKKVTITTANGQTVYDIELERRGVPNPVIRVSGDGEVLRTAGAADAPTPVGVYPGYVAPATGMPPKLDLAATPDAVQKTIRQAAAGREIAALYTEKLNGRDAYAVQFREEGRNPWLYVAADGSVLRPMEKPPVLGLGTTLSDTPAAVQDTIRRQAADGEITKIDKEGRSGEPDVYRVELKDAHGSYRIVVSENGEILESTRPGENPAKRG